MRVTWSSGRLGGHDLLHTEPQSCNRQKNHPRLGVLNSTANIGNAFNSHHHYKNASSYHFTFYSKLIKEHISSQNKAYKEEDDENDISSVSVQSDGIFVVR